MGMFDSVMADCPTCGQPVEFQSKAGECYLNVYCVDDAPTEVLVDVLNEPHYCRKCGNWMALIDAAFPPGNPPRPDNVKAARLREPGEGEVTVHSSQSFLRWWDAPFSYGDVVEEDRPA